MRKDPKALRAVEESLKTGKSSDQVYVAHNKENEKPNSILNIRSVTNLRHKMNKQSNVKWELDVLLEAVKKNSFVKSLKVTKDRYTAVCHLDNLLTDMKRFCVDKDSIFAVDTTFDIVPGLWLTDTTYQNLAL